MNIVNPVRVLVEQVPGDIPLLRPLPENLLKVPNWSFVGRPCRCVLFLPDDTQCQREIMNQVSLASATAARGQRKTVQPHHLEFVKWCDLATLAPCGRKDGPRLDATGSAQASARGCGRGSCIIRTSRPISRSMLSSRCITSGSCATRVRTRKHCKQHDHWLHVVA